MIDELDMKILRYLCRGIYSYNDLAKLCKVGRNTIHQVKFLWRTYGEHDIVLTILCDKDDVGTCIYNLREALEKRNISINKFDVSVSIFWEKMHLVP